MNIFKNHPGDGSIQKGLYKITEPGNRLLLVFTLEGMLITLVNNLVGNNNNIFATRLGASDLQLSLLTYRPDVCRRDCGSLCQRNASCGSGNQ